MTVKQSLKRKSMHMDNMEKHELKKVKTLIIEESKKDKTNNQVITINLKKNKEYK